MKRALRETHQRRERQQRIDEQHRHHECEAGLKSWEANVGNRGDENDGYGNDSYRFGPQIPKSLYKSHDL
jgi:hypothetical protein